MSQTRNRKLASAIRYQLSNARLAAVATGMAFASVQAQQAPLPKVCSIGCSDTVSTFVTSGSASYTAAGTVGTITQQSDRAILNWRSFDIAAGHTVNFVQPSKDSAALNRIFSNDPSVIQGALNANGQVYLVNNNGIIFGGGAQVNVGALVASAINISDDVFNKLGLAGAINAQPIALAAFEGGAKDNAKIEIGKGASINAASRVFLIAPEVENRGTITTPDGQSILAASYDRVYVASDTELRGLLVEVGTGGNVSNFGEIITERGNTTLVGLAVNQSGRIRATTSVNVNGSIRLVAQDGATVVERGSNRLGLAASRTGSMIFAENSTTEIVPDADGKTAVDGQSQSLSSLVAVGSNIDIQSNARIVVPGGKVELRATIAPSSESASGTRSNSIHLASGAVIDVSGDDSSVVAMERNQASIKLFGNELADAPIQRDGPLARQEITVDLRDGTPLTDISRLRDAIARTANERLSVGGSVSLEAGGDVVLNPGSTIDVSGGQVRYLDGYLNTTKLVTESGKVVDISQADPSIRYTGIVGRTAASSNRWQSTPEQQSVALAELHPGYVEGKDAGSVSIQTSAGQVSLNGILQGHATQGALQLSIPTSNAGLDRHYRETPLGGLLSIAGVESIVLGKPLLMMPSEAILRRPYQFPGLEATGTSKTNLDVGLRLFEQPYMTLSPDAVRDSGFSRLDLSARNIELPENVALNLAAGGSVALSAAKIRIDGDVSIAGGSLTATAALGRVTTGEGEDRVDAMTIGATSHINLSGRWINNSASSAAGSAYTMPLYINGGRLKLESYGNLVLQEGSRIDVSAGAQLRENNSLNYGRAGSVALISKIPNDNTMTSLTLGAQLSGYGFKQGGSIAITAGSISIADRIPASIDKNDDTFIPGQLNLSPTFFSEGGFANYSFAVDRGSFEIADGVQLSLSPQTWQLVDRIGTASYWQQSTGTDLNQFTELTRPLELARGTSSFTAQVKRSESIDDAATLYVGTNASIQTEIGGSIRLSSDSDLYVNGSLTARGGNIALSLQNPIVSNDEGYRANQSIYLGDAARLDVSGVARVELDSIGRRVGDVVSGGSIQLSSLRGFVMSSPGSVMDVSGASASFDLPLAVFGRYQPELIATDAGSIHIKSAEGMNLSGKLYGAAGGASAAGGEFSLTLDTVLRVPKLEAAITDTPFPTAASEIVIGKDFNTVIGRGVPMPSARSGKAYVSADDLANGGFESIKLRALAQPTAAGVISFEGDVALNAARRIVLDAGAIASNGFSANLHTALASIGSTDAETKPPSTLPLGGNGKLSVAADHIDFFGNTMFTGFATNSATASLSFNSAGDIRFVGTRGVTDTYLGAKGSVTAAANIDFVAAQLYPATLTDYSISILGDKGRVSVLSSNSSATLPLSAAGTLRFAAADIIQAGTVRAPFGQIYFDAARRLELRDQSVTSTSGAGVVVPFGSIELSKDWVYSLGIVQKLITDAPSQNIVLRSPDVQLQAGSTVDISGGGDLWSYEFVKGPGGSTDILLGDNPEGAFAILPGSNLFGAFDPIESAKAGIETGSTVYLSGFNGLAAGQYARLPARYALLPGAFLVVPVKASALVQPDLVTTLVDGVTTVVSGRNAVAGTDIQAAQWSSYAVLNGEQVRQRAEYKESYASTFFTDDARSTRDAGKLTIDAAKSVRLDGKLISATTSGRAAQVDVVANSLALVNARTTSTQRVELVASELQNFGAASVLLGGNRTLTDSGMQVDVRADKLVVENGVTLSAEEIILTARDSVAVISGATLRAEGTGASKVKTYSLTGDGAFARVAASDQVTVERNNSNGLLGTLSIFQGASLTGNAINLEASRDLRSEGNLSTNGGSLSLTASQISLGAAPFDTKGLVLTNTDLARYQSGELLLNSRSTIDLYGAVSADLDAVKLDAAGLRGFFNDKLGSNINANSLAFGNSRNSVSSVAGTGAGDIEFKANTIAINPGNFDISGFASTLLAAQREVVGDGAASLRMHGDLAIQSPRISAESGADIAWVADGALTTRQPTIPSGLAPTSTPFTALGARMTFSGQSIRHGNNIELPSGIVTMTATGADGIIFDSNASIDVSGRDIDFREVVVGSPGGAVNLMAGSGAITLGNQVLIDVSGGTSSGEAGRVSLFSKGKTHIASSAVLRGSAAAVERQGSFEIDADHVSSGYMPLNAQLNAGGFGERRAIAVKSGDINVDFGHVVNTRNLVLSTDGGSITVAGRINANGEQAGNVRLSARDNINIQNSARIDARATDANEAGGLVELSTRSGTVAMHGAINVSGTNVSGVVESNGRVSIRAPRTVTPATTDGVAVTPISGNIVGAKRIDIEAFRTYITTSVDDSLLNNIRSDVSTYIANADAIKAMMGVADDSRFHLLPGVEIASNSDLALNSAWDLFDWREGGEAGVLTLRAAGNLNLNQNLSDGFAWQSVGELENFGLLPERYIVQTGPSWSYRLVAGAGVNAADPLRVTRGVGNVVIADNTHIRTGTGSIDVAAGNDIRLTTGTSALYTVGENRGSGVVDAADADALLRGDFLHNGGHINIAAGGSLTGVSDRPFADWMARMVGAPFYYQAVYRPDLLLPAVWAIDVTRFQGIGALGGGNIRANIGLDMIDSTLAVATTGQANAMDGSDTRIAGGGRIDVDVGRDIVGGNYIVEKGVGILRAGGSIGHASGVGSLGPIVQLGAAQMSLSARANVMVETAFNPMMAPRDPNQGLFDVLLGLGGPDSNFFTYDLNSSIALSSTSGTTVVRGSSQLLNDRLNSIYSDRLVALENIVIYPGGLSAVSLVSDVVLDGLVTLFPSADSSLSILAGQNVRAIGSGGVLQSEADLDQLPSVKNASHILDSGESWTSRLRTRGPIPMHVGDTTPSIVSTRLGTIGTIDDNGPSGGLAFYFGEAVHLSAGKDVVDLGLNVQHANSASFTLVQAGRDIVYSTARSAGGLLASSGNVSGIQVAGSGNVDIVAGRNVDFGSAKGIETVGNSQNNALPNGGANINIWTGYSVKPDFDAFTQKYLIDSQDYAPALKSYLSEIKTDSKLSDIDNFRSLPESEQRRFIGSVLFGEVKKGGLDDFTAGFDAINLLFPKLDQDSYRGDLTSFLSYIRTVDGGNINIIVPNGLVNAGVAAASGITKGAGDLGVIVQGAGDINAMVRGDFAVNASRVFALDGGDIMIWSSTGDIDAGRGSKAALSIPPPVVNIDPVTGDTIVELPAAVSGSGIRTAVSTPNRDPGDVYLFAPQGIVDAGDAGIVSAGNITIAATQVVGADNIQVGGTAVGVPVDSGGVGASLAGVSATANSANNATAMTSDSSKSSDNEQAPVAEAALGWLEVFVTGLGEEGCKQEDIECLKRQQ